MNIRDLSKHGVTVTITDDELLELNNALSDLSDDEYLPHYLLFKKIHQLYNLVFHGWHSFGEFKKRDEKYQEYLKKHDKEEANE